MSITTVRSSTSQELPAITEQEFFELRQKIHDLSYHFLILHAKQTDLLFDSQQANQQAFRLREARRGDLTVIQEELKRAQAVLTEEPPAPEPARIQAQELIMRQIARRDALWEYIEQNKRYASLINKTADEKFREIAKRIEIVKSKLALAQKSLSSNEVFLSKACDCRYCFTTWGLRR